MHRLSAILQRLWYQPKLSLWLLPLLPLSGLYFLLSQYDKHRSIKHRFDHKVPVWVVGNISVGGTGKTPVTIAIAEYCQKNNIHVGIVSRGYGGSLSTNKACIIEANSSADEVGDEPLLMSRRLDCPVVICAKRNIAIQSLLSRFPKTQLIISDDGLQHYAMSRQFEIAVIDGQRGLGNQQLLPTGPLRELPFRLSCVDMIIANGSLSNASGVGLPADSSKLFSMELQASPLVPLNSLTNTANVFPDVGDTVHAIAGIGNPQRFFKSLLNLGFTVIEHSFADHAEYSALDLNFDDSHALIMTEKDAVKCAEFKVEAACFYLPVTAQFSDEFYARLDQQITDL